MKILFVNKFLYPNGGSEAYVFKLGEQLISLGHKVEYFGMEHKDRCVGNSANAYTSEMDFHNASLFDKIVYSFKTIYSKEARKEIRRVLDHFEPDVCHLNNFNYQLTPSVILEIKQWSKQTGKKCKIVYTAHDYQLVCPNHMCNNPNNRENCEKCLGGNFLNCVKGKCIHNSALKSAVGMSEAYFWKWKGVYKDIDTIICCSEFLKSKLDANPLFKTKTVKIYNFVDRSRYEEKKKKDYVLYFGRFSEEKGIRTLLKVCRELKDIQFVFAGKGALEEEINNIQNINNVGFKDGEELEKLICEAKFSVYPSEWYENCPLAVLESLSLGTPVLASDIGGIPELIISGETGELFESGNANDLKEKILSMWQNEDKLYSMSKNCFEQKFDNAYEYCEKILKIYEQ